MRTEMMISMHRVKTIVTIRIHTNRIIESLLPQKLRLGIRKWLQARLSIP